MALLPGPAESWVMPGSAAETRADACRPSGPAMSRSRCRCATGWWAVQPSRCLSRCPASAPACRRRRRCWSPGPAPDLEGRRWAARPWWSEPGGSRRASGAPCSSAPSPPSRLGGRAWRRPASRRAGQDRPAVATTACALGCGAAWVFAGTSRPPPAPPPADWVALLFPCSRGMKRTAAPWRGASQASCDCLPPAVRIDAALAALALGQSSPVAEGLTPSSEPMTTPRTRGRREPCRQGPQPLHRHGLDPPRALATAAGSPASGGLVGDPDHLGDLGGPAALSEQLGGAQPARLVDLGAGQGRVGRVVRIRAVVPLGSGHTRIVAYPTTRMLSNL